MGMEGNSASEPQIWEDRAEPAGGLEEGEGFGGEHLGQDVRAGTTADKKARALAACMEQRLAYVKCLRKGVFADCSKSEKALWDCYAEQRGVNGSKKFGLFGVSSKDS